ncbi:GAD-like domain-containing protein [Rhizobium tumorigenes]|uniref:GAD-like domain-containing protein n=1 Tax=Rhizobium tumorigenes TaxID=2041385 RepID=A0AAF1K9I2_9HYPH|nr:GAD-like domain-containing protein [Rhizobium tumorigenes]WFR98767.1 GAD-like domain-containing protein [Rhizobium tumorigenes]
MNLSNDIREYIEDFGAPDPHFPFSGEEKHQLQGRFPTDLILFMEKYGRAILQEGQIQLCHPNDFQGVLALISAEMPSFLINIATRTPTARSANYFVGTGTMV